MKILFVPFVKNPEKKNQLLKKVVLFAPLTKQSSPKKKQKNLLNV